MLCLDTVAVQQGDVVGLKHLDEEVQVWLDDCRAKLGPAVNTRIRGAIRRGRRRRGGKSGGRQAKGRQRAGRNGATAGKKPGNGRP